MLAAAEANPPLALIVTEPSRYTAAEKELVAALDNPEVLVIITLSVIVTVPSVVRAATKVEEAVDEKPAKVLGPSKYVEEVKLTVAALVNPPLLVISIVSVAVTAPSISTTPSR